MGSPISGTARSRPAIALIVSSVNIRYLKIKIIKMLKASMTAITPRDFALLSRTRDTAMPNSQFPAIESIITSTNHGSPHA